MRWLVDILTRPRTPHSWRTLRVLSVLTAAARAGIVPLRQTDLHALAYLANAMSPIWNLPPQDSKVLKQTDGPYYPALQRSLDRLVGAGLVSVDESEFLVTRGTNVRFLATFRVDLQRAQPILDALWQYPVERRVFQLLVELCLSASSTVEDELAETALVDLNFADPGVQLGHEVDALGARESASVALARRFAGVMPPGVRATPATSVQLYVKYLQQSLVRSA